MSEQKKTNEKKLSLAPLNFEEALKGLLATEPPKEKKDKPATKRRKRASKAKESNHE